MPRGHDVNLSLATANRKSSSRRFDAFSTTMNSTPNSRLVDQRTLPSSMVIGVGWLDTVICKLTGSSTAKYISDIMAQPPRDRLKVEPSPGFPSTTNVTGHFT